MIEPTPNTGAREKKGARAYAKLLDPAYAVLALCVIFALVFLSSASRRNKALSGEIVRLSKKAEGYAAKAGDVVPPFASVDLEGRQAAVAVPSGRKQLLFIFSKYCSACVTQLPVWDRVAREMKTEGLDIRGVSLDSADETRTYFGDKAPAFPVILAPGDVFARAYRVERIPQVMLISEQGEVDWVIAGALTDERLRDLVAKTRAGKLAAATGAASPATPAGN